jgi:hypothetical protein
MRKNVIRFSTIIFLLLTASGLSFSQIQTQNEQENTTLKIALFGPGTPLYSWWGHISIIIEDTASADSRLVDYGIFSFEKENFFGNFALGRLVFSSGSSPAQAVINSYIAQNRDVTVFTLNVLPAKKREIIERIENDLLPENRDYYYHQFRDNCATRIRDIINALTEGQFYSRYANEASPLTLREHLRRYTWFSPFIDWFLNFLLGRGTDIQATKWDAMFLPSEVALSMRDFEYTAADGNNIQLVSETETLYTAVSRPPVPGTPPNRRSFALLAVLLFAGMCVFFMVMDIRQKKTGKAAWLLSQGLLGCFIGLAGSLLFFMSFFTNHDYTYNNLNTLIANPLLLAALPLGFITLASDNYIKEAITIRIINILWTVVFLSGIASLILNAFPRYYQQNQMTIALILPCAFTFSLFPRWLARFARHFLWRFLP